jgi:hypothetical protein
MLAPPVRAENFVGPQPPGQPQGLHPYGFVSSSQKMKRAEWSSQQNWQSNCDILRFVLM